MQPIMKKYIKPESTLFTLSSVQMLATSDPKYYEVEGENDQYSNHNNGWNNTIWSNSSNKEGR